MQQVGKNLDANVLNILKMKKIKLKNINLNFINKFSNILLMIFVSIFIVISVFAFGTSNPSTFGHSAKELDLSVGIDGDVVFNGNLDVLGEGIFGGWLRIGNTEANCDSNSEGIIRYSSNKELEYCDGTSWNMFKAGCEIIDSTHSCLDCTNAGGIPTDIGGGKSVCKFSIPFDQCPPTSIWSGSEVTSIKWDYLISSNYPGAPGGSSGSQQKCTLETVCPSGWSLYQDWTSTLGREYKGEGYPVTYCSPYGDSCITRWDCQTEEHSFSNTPRESCQAGVHHVGSCDRPAFIDCYAGISEAGCY
tara:strand:- start:1682 stop:2593 length:912 start_codon:yes stop_codon:yes gene_type:complete